MFPVAYNTLSGNGRSRVHGKWISYRDTNRWSRIAPEFRNDGSAFVADYAPYRYWCPQFADGTAVLEANNRWDILTRSNITAPAMEFAITPVDVRPNVAGRIDPDRPTQVYYPDAWAAGVSLRYTVWHGRAPRPTHEVMIDPQQITPGQSVTVSFDITSPNAITLVRDIDGTKVRPKNPDNSEWTGAVGDTATIPETGAAIHMLDGGLPHPQRGAGIKKPVAWYAGREPVQITVAAAIVASQTIRLTKTVPSWLIDEARAAGELIFADVTHTLYPDPHIESTTFDGIVQRSVAAESWATMIASAGTGSADNGSYNLNCQKSGADYTLNVRHIFLFDASAVAGTVLTASLNYQVDFLSVADKTVRIVEAVTASNTGASQSDYENMGDVSFSADTATSGTGWKAVNCNAAGISYLDSAVGGIVKIGLRHAEDKGGETTGPAAGFHRIVSAEAAGTANDPYLELITGSGLISSAFMLGMLGR